MGKLSPISTRKFRKFLQYVGCEYSRIEGDHEIWKRDGLKRPVTFITNEKEVPPFHIRTNLKTLEMSSDEYLKIITKI